jgi:HNH endonuclease
VPEQKYRPFPPKLRDKEIARFAASVKVGRADECWPWIGSLAHNGYGVMSVRLGKYKHHNFVASRIAYFLATGKDPGQKVVMHSCDNPPCCNLAHLSLGTNTQNHADKVAKGRQARGDTHGHTKTSDATALKIYKLFKKYGPGYGVQARIARELGTSNWTVHGVIRAEKRKHLNLEPLETHYRRSPKEIREMRQLRKSGVTIVELGERYGISHVSVSAICNRKVYRYVED